MSNEDTSDAGSAGSNPTIRYGEYSISTDNPEEVASWLMQFFTPNQ